MNKAIFLDRDGVINKERKDYVKTIDELEIFQNVSEYINKLKKNNYLVIVITNQSAINRNLTTTKKIHEIHNEICLRAQRAEISLKFAWPDEICLSISKFQRAARAVLYWS